MKRAFAFLACAGLAAAAFAAPQIGRPAPGFTATDINGKTIHLSDYKGKIVVLESYNQDCPFCHNHYQTGAMQELQRDLAAKGVVWLLVDSVNPHNSSHRTPEQARKEQADQKMTLTAWIDDSSGQVGKAYGMRTTPHMFVVDKDGTLVYNGAIDDQATPDHDPRTANNYVKDAVSQLLAGEKVSITETKPYGCGVKYGG
ncbi:MAG: redoxin domain-containing protein [Verrucomicrobiota bacterium]|jgi:peroxiredoxin